MERKAKCKLWHEYSNGKLSSFLFLSLKAKKAYSNIGVDVRITRRELSADVTYRTAWVAGYMYKATSEIEASRVMDMYCRRGGLKEHGDVRIRGE